MPRCQEPTKDGANTEMPRGAVRKPRCADVRMGQPTGRDGPVPLSECIGQREGTWGTETSQYLEEKKTTVIPQVVASERGRA